jgi:5'-phosphate synthase pdxT subunit
LKIETVGVLGLQGCVTPHIWHLEQLNSLGGLPFLVKPLVVKSPQDLQVCNRLILPGGESSTVLKLLDRLSFFELLAKYCSRYPVWGVCAGAILLSQIVENPVQRSLNVAPVRAIRNFYGSQLDSFSTSISVQSPLGTVGNERKTMEVDFIRAPRLIALSDEVEVLAEIKDNTIGLRYRNVILTAFHTELGTDSYMHKMFVCL